MEEHKFNCDGVGAIFQVLQSDTVSIFGAGAALCLGAGAFLWFGAARLVRLGGAELASPSLNTLHDHAFGSSIPSKSA